LQEFLDERPVPSDMCLKTGAPHPVVISAVGELNPLADYFLALVYRPAKSFHSNNSLNNKTMHLIILPELSLSLYVEEFLPLGVNQNSDVDLALVSKCTKDPKHWMCKNFSDRVQAVTILRQTCGKNSIIWLGGPDVCSALGDYVASCGVTEMTECDIATGVNGQIFIRSSQHPSAPILAGMADVVAQISRSSLRLFRAVVEEITSNQPLLYINVLNRLTEIDAQKLRQKQDNANWIMVTFPSVTNPLNLAQTKIRSILYHDFDGPMRFYDIFWQHVSPKRLL